MASRDVSLLVKQLREAVPLIIEEYERMFPERSLIVVCTARPVTEQWSLYQRGRKFEDLAGNLVEFPTHLDFAAGRVKVRSVSKKHKVTNLDGLKKRSKHNTSAERPLAKAVDFGVIVAGKYMGGYRDHYLYEPLGELAHKHGLIHGGTDYKRWKDYPHVEVQGPRFYLPKEEVA